MLFDRPRVSSRSPVRGGLVSAAAHLALALLAVVVTRTNHGPDNATQTSPSLPATLIWVPTNAPLAGGGEGGGTRSATPPRQAQQPGKDAITVPAAPAVPAPAPVTAAPPEPVQTLALSVHPLAAGMVPLAGVITERPSADPASGGSGIGPGADGRDGTGIGPGTGRGDGPGNGAERGGEGPPGNGVSWPRLLRDVKPAYTAGAMRARITGSVGMSCVVDRDGSVRDCQLTRSLDPQHGLDEEALRVVRLWRFEPARRLDEPVPVRVTIELAFSMR